MRDLVNGQDLGAVTGSLAMEVPCHGVQVLRLQPVRCALSLDTPCFPMRLSPDASVHQCRDTEDGWQRCMLVWLS